MTLRTFWIFLLKIFGLKLLFVDFASTFSQLIAILFDPMVYTSSWSPDIIVVGLTSFMVFLGVTWVFLFQPHRIVNILKLDSGFDEPRITGHVHRSTVLFIVVAVICGVILVDSIPRLITELISYVRFGEGNSLFAGTPESSRIILLLFKSALALIGLTHPQLVVNWIEARRRKLAPDRSNQEADKDAD